MAEESFKPRQVHWEELRRLYADDPLLAELFSRMDDWSANGGYADYFDWASATATVGGTPTVTWKGTGTLTGTGTTITTATPLSIYSTGSPYFTTSTSATGNTITIGDSPTLTWKDDGTYTLKYDHIET